MPINHINIEENLLKPVSFKNVKAIQYYIVPKYIIEKGDNDYSDYHVDLIGLQ
jgi:hypothetical protein